MPQSTLACRTHRETDLLDVAFRVSRATREKKIYFERRRTNPRKNHPPQSLAGQARSEVDDAAGDFVKSADEDELVRLDGLQDGRVRLELLQLVRDVHHDRLSRDQKMRTRTGADDSNPKIRGERLRGLERAGR